MLQEGLRGALYLNFLIYKAVTLKKASATARLVIIIHKVEKP